MKFFWLISCFIIVNTQNAMQSSHPFLAEEHAKALQAAIQEDSPEKFHNLLSYVGIEGAQLRAFECAVKLKARKIISTISQTLKEKFLILAARHRSLLVTEFLTQPTIYQYSPATETAFYEALKKKHFATAKLLIDKGININRLTHDIFDEYSSVDNVSEQKTLLHHLIYDGEENIPFIKWLLEQGADPDKPSLEGNHPLHDTVWDEFAIVELLCDYGADPNARNARGNTTLMEFIRCGKSWGHEESRGIIQLIAAGANVNAQNSTGATALHLAVIEGNPCAALILLHFGASQEIRDKNQHIPCEVLLDNEFIQRNLIQYLQAPPIEYHEFKALFSNPILPKLHKKAVETQEAIKKKKVKLP